MATEKPCIKSKYNEFERNINKIIVKVLIRTSLLIIINTIVSFVRCVVYNFHITDNNESRGWLIVDSQYLMKETPLIATSRVETEINSCL